MVAEGEKISLSDPLVVATLGPRGLTADTPVETRRELKVSPKFEAFRKASEYCARVRHRQMEDRQTAIARFNESIEHKAVDGLGTKIASIDMEIYFQMQAKYGDDCWNDPEFVKAFLRDNPACRVKVTRGTRGQEYGGRSLGDRTAHKRPLVDRSDRKLSTINSQLSTGSRP